MKSSENQENMFSSNSSKFLFRAIQKYIERTVYNCVAMVTKNYFDEFQMLIGNGGLYQIENKPFVRIHNNKLPFYLHLKNELLMLFIKTRSTPMQMMGDASANSNRKMRIHDT